jgi:hypothetical protein
VARTQLLISQKLAIPTGLSNFGKDNNIYIIFTNLSKISRRIKNWEIIFRYYIWLGFAQPNGRILRREGELGLGKKEIAALNFLKNEI